MAAISRSFLRCFLFVTLCFGCAISADIIPCLIPTETVLGTRRIPVIECSIDTTVKNLIGLALFDRNTGDSLVYADTVGGTCNPSNSQDLRCIYRNNTCTSMVTVRAEITDLKEARLYGCRTSFWNHSSSWDKNFTFNETSNPDSSMFIPPAGTKCGDELLTWQMGLGVPAAVLLVLLIGIIFWICFLKDTKRCPFEIRNSAATNMSSVILKTRETSEQQNPLLTEVKVDSAAMQTAASLPPNSQQDQRLTDSSDLPVRDTSKQQTTVASPIQETEVGNSTSSQPVSPRGAITGYHEQSSEYDPELQALTEEKRTDIRQPAEWQQECTEQKLPAVCPFEGYG